MSKKNSFVMYVDYDEQFSKLSNEEFGELMRSVMRYVKTGEVPDSPLMLAICFDVIKTKLDEDISKWYETKEERSAAGKKGARAKAAKAKAQASDADTAQVKEQEIKQEELQQAPEASDCQVATIEQETERSTCNEPSATSVKSKLLCFAQKIWDAFPNSQKKPTVERWFVRNRPTEEQVDKMLAAIEEQCGSIQWSKSNGQYIPSLVNWLSSKGWENKLPAKATIYGSSTSSHTAPKEEARRCLPAFSYSMADIEHILETQFCTAYAL